jgi:hypothetical protein
MNPPSPVPIKLRLRELPQLFNSLDPSPFHDRDLDADAEEFILSWARELAPTQEVELVLHLTTPPSPERAEAVEAAVRHYGEGDEDDLTVAKAMSHQNAESMKP